MPHRPDAGASARAQYRRLWARGRPRRVAARIILAAAAFGVATWLLSWRAGLLAAVVVAAADTIRQWRRHSPAAAWRKGARGEQKTARILRRLERRGYTVLHDRAIPGSQANIDHLVIGPSGVWVVDSKAWHRNTRISGARGQIWIGRRPATNLVQSAIYETRAVERALGRRLGAPVNARPVLAVHGARLPRFGGLAVDGVPLLRARRVPRWISRYGDPLDPGRVDQLAAAAAATFPAKTDDTRQDAGQD